MLTRCRKIRFLEVHIHEFPAIKCRDEHPEDKSLTLSEDTQVKLLGNRIFGSFSSMGRRYRMEGRIDRDTFITGTWSYEVEVVTYHGAFQIQILLHAKTMKGGRV